MRKKVVPILLGLFAMVLIFVSFSYYVYKSQYISDMKNLNNISERITSRLSSAFSYVDVLELLIQFDDGVVSEEQFNKLTNIAMGEDTCIASFQLAPDAVVTYINPLEGNESAIGHELLSDYSRRDTVLEAINSQDIVVQGPVISIQGGNLIFGRKAIMIDGEFWGLATISIDYDALIKECGLTPDELEFDYSLYVYNSDNELDSVWGNTDISESSSLYDDIQMPHQSWRIYIKHKLTALGLFKSYGICFAMALVAGIAVFILSRYFVNRLYLSKLDRLTKTLNRIELEKQIEKLIRHSKHSSALLAVNIDNFKEINDNYGHLAGDEVLICTAERMRVLLEKKDLLSRAGGDEYLFFIYDLKSEEMLQLSIQQIKEACTTPIILGQNNVNIGLSIGYAIFPADGTTFIALCELADKRMYESRNANN